MAVRKSIVGVAVLIVLGGIGATIWMVVDSDPAYISGSKAIQICARASEVKNPPAGIEATLRHSPRFEERTSATWWILFENRSIYMNCEIDAETGRMLLSGTRG